MLLSHNWASCFVALLGGAVYGYNTGIISGLSTPIVRGRFFVGSNSSDQSTLEGVLTACILLGCFVGSFIGVQFAHRWGRKRALLIMSVNCILSTIIMASVQSFASLVVFRSLLGFSVGFAGCVCPMYVSEMTDAEISGRMGTVFQIAICGSICIAQIVNYAVYPHDVDDNTVLEDWQWQLQFGFGSIPGALLLILINFIPESEAYLPPLDADLNADPHSYMTMHDAGDGSSHGGVGMDDGGGGSGSGGVDGRSGWAVLFSREGVRSLFIALVLAIAAQLTGINAIIFYAPKIFKDAELDDVLLVTIAVVGVWNLVAVFISFALVDKIGRRPLMLGALFVMTLGIGLLSLAYEAFPEQKSAVSIIAVVLFLGAFECGPGPLFFVMASESFPESHREEGLSTANALAWIFNIIVSFGFPVVNTSAGSAAVFFVFALAGGISFLLIFFFLPESKGAYAHSHAHSKHRNSTTQSTSTIADYSPKTPIATSTA